MKGMSLLPLSCRPLVVLLMMLFPFAASPQEEPTALLPDSVLTTDIKTARLFPRTNLLLPLLNVGVEVPLGNRFSVGADWYYPWAFRESSHKDCFQADGLSVEGRCWLGGRHKGGSENKPYRLLGHSIGLFAMGGRYDMERNYSGHQGEYILGGIDYLYAMPIFRGKMHLELSLGVGYFYSKATHYNVYERGGRGYRDKDVRKIFEYVGPLKANVSLVWPIFKK